jgi:hypothetical protein
MLFYMGVNLGLKHRMLKAFANTLMGKVFGPTGKRQQKTGKNYMFRRCMIGTVLVSKLCLGYQIEREEMCGACSTDVWGM